jgi:hypothetical protein
MIGGGQRMTPYKSVAEQSAGLSFTAKPSWTAAHLHANLKAESIGSIC